MIVVSGCPRSGTSLMMDCLRVALGESRIVGEKFPQLAQRDRQRLQGANEPDAHHRCRLYILDQQADPAEDASIIDMNPNGFWECSYTVRGVKYHPGIDAPDSKVNPQSVCKIVSQGLAQSDPRYIERVVMMIRNPRAVARSQERLRRNIPGDQSPRVHSPAMFVRVCLNAARWLSHHQQVKVHLVEFDDLIERPVETLAGVRSFLGEGDFESAANLIEPKLRRSEPDETVGHHLWPKADAIYERFRVGDWAGVLDAHEPDTKMRRWPCVRFGNPVIAQQCNLCMTRPEVMANFKKTAEARKIDWRTQPCLYECGFDPDRTKYKTIEESIANSHWNV